MYSQVRKQRVGDLSIVQAGVQARLLSNIATLTLGIGAFGFQNSIEAVLSVVVTSQSITGTTPAEVIAQLGGLSNTIGISVVQSGGTTVSLLVTAAGY